jgi:hypothetical protein
MAFADGIWFTAGSAGTSNFSDGTPVVGFRAMSGNLVNGAVYSYRAQDAARTQWEIGYGAYNSGTGVLARTTIVASSTGSKINFTSNPLVLLTPNSVDLAGFAALIDEDSFASNDATKAPSQQSTKAYIASQIAALVNSAPGVLDTLDELAAALGDDANFAATMTTALAGKQASSDELTGLAALSANGLVARTADGTYASRTLTGPAAGISVTNGNGVSGNPTIALTNDIAAIEALASTGIAVRIGADTWAQRSITSPNAGLTTTNGDGVSGNISINLSDDAAAIEALGSTGFAVRTGSNAWAQRSIAVTASTGLSVTNGDGVSGNPTLAGVDATTSVKGVSELATAAEYITGTDTARCLVVDQVWAAALNAVLTDAATISVNLASGINFGGSTTAKLNLAGNRTLGAPSNPKGGQCGVLWFGASTSTRTLTLNAAWNLMAGVEAGPYSITTSQTLGIAYICLGTTVYVYAILRIG